MHKRRVCFTWCRAMLSRKDVKTQVTLWAFQKHWQTLQRYIEDVWKMAGTYLLTVNSRWFLTRKTGPKWQPPRQHQPWAIYLGWGCSPDRSGFSKNFLEEGDRIQWFNREKYHTFTSFHCLKVPIQYPKTADICLCLLDGPELITLWTGYKPFLQPQLRWKVWSFTAFALQDLAQRKYLLPGLIY